MPSSQRSAETPATPLARWGQLLHHYFLPILFGVYVLAALAPGPGAAIREYPVSLLPGPVIHAPLLMVALLLFCAAVTIDWSQVGEVVNRPSLLLTALLAGWLGPALAVAALGTLLPQLFEVRATSDMLVGLTVVAAMPVANSSAGWTQNSGGNVALCLALIVLSIFLSPLATPQMLELMGYALEPSETMKIERLVTEFSGAKFIVWVILPSTLGAIVAWLAGRERIANLKPLIRLVTLADILLLNYANGSLAARKAWTEESWTTLLAAMLIGAAVSVFGLLIAAGLAKAFQLQTATRTALLYGLSMKHTGLALVLAGASEAMKDSPRVILVIMMATLLQHVAAALVDWRLEYAKPAG